MLVYVILAKGLEHHFLMYCEWLSDPVKSNAAQRSHVPTNTITLGHVFSLTWVGLIRWNWVNFSLGLMNPKLIIDHIELLISDDYSTGPTRSSLTGQLSYVLIQVKANYAIRVSCARLRVWKVQCSLAQLHWNEWLTMLDKAWQERMKIIRLPTKDELLFCPW